MATRIVYVFHHKDIIKQLKQNICHISSVVKYQLKYLHYHFRKTNGSNREKDELELSKKHDADFDEETYAYINPTDVSDVPHDIKALNMKSDLNNEYFHLHASKKEKVQYDMLHATQNIRRGNGPTLPDRPMGNPGDPYEKLRTQNREQRVYEKMRDHSRNIEFTDRSNASYETRLSSEERHSYLVLQDNYLTPARGQGNDDFLEGYERPDPQPLYKRY